MERQHEQVSEPLPAEVVTALGELARMALQAGCAISDPPGSLATLLFERVLVFCAAQRGALFLITPDQPASGQNSLPPFRMLHTLALHDLSEEEARALLTVLLPTDASSETALSQPNWIGYYLPLVAPFVQQQGKFEVGHSTGEPSGDQMLRSVEAALLLGWDEQGDVGVATVEKGRALLPLITDAAGAVLVNSLLAQRVHELEMTVNRRSLQAMELLKAELLATISHELRSPLASIKGYTATLLRHERRISREERHEFLLAIAAASDHLERIVDRLLELSQLETGSIQIERSLVDVARLVDEAMIAAQQRISAQFPGRFAFHLHLKNAAGLPTQHGPVVMADRRYLREVLDHLLENALSYSPEGGIIDVIVHPIQAPSEGKVSSRARKAEASPESPTTHTESTNGQQGVQGPRQMLEICVCDHGLGIPPEHLDRVFDRFHRVDTRLTREVNGLGVGLTICKGIVELHGGIIWAASCPAGGSAFHVWLPMEEDERSQVPLTEKSTS
jgi:signal transduction histidine kinase